jgi:pyruvate dehydrogenase E2 component (dihydrolipoamide acetyltransferase)
VADAPEGPAIGPKGEAELIELGQDQQAFARRVAESKATIPHVYFTQRLASTPARAALIAAAARALRETPRLNSAYRDGNVEVYSRINVAFAAEHDGSTAYPVIRDADRKDAEEIEAEAVELEKGVGEGSLASPAFTGATFTVIDMSRGGISAYAPIIARGQAATLGAGGEELTLACDHRVVQDSAGAEFLRRVVSSLGG